MPAEKFFESLKGHCTAVYEPIGEYHETHQPEDQNARFRRPENPDAQTKLLREFDGCASLFEFGLRLSGVVFAGLF